MILLMDVMVTDKIMSKLIMEAQSFLVFVLFWPDHL